MKYLNKDGYFPNRDRECFVSSLSNLLLVHFRDDDLAHSVFNDARAHSLVLEDGGTFFGSWPFLINELTKGQYVATLYVGSNFPNESLDPIEKEYSSENFKLYKKVHEKSLKSKEILPGIAYIGFPPLILSMGRKGGVPSHTLLYIEDQSVIDNGTLNKCNIFSDKYIIGGILKVNKNSKG